MATLLRRPGSLARFSRRAAEYAAYSRCPLALAGCQSRPPSIFNGHQSRCYAQLEPPNERGSNTGRRGANGKPRTPRGQKPALSPEELEAMEKAEEQLRALLPKSKMAVVERAFAQFKREGIPEDVKALLKDLGDFRGLSLSRTVSAASKFAFLLAKYEADEIFGPDNKGAETSQAKNGAKETNQAQAKEEPEPAKREPEQEPEPWETELPKQKQESQEPDSSKQQQKKQKKKQNQEGQEKQKSEDKNGSFDPTIRLFGFKMDLSTMLVSAIVSYWLYRSVNPSEASKDITWQEFRTNFFDKGLVTKLTVINRSTVRVELHREAVASMYPDSPAARPNFYYYFTIGSVEAFERNLADAHNELGIPSSQRIPVAYTDAASWGPIIASVAPTLLLFGALFWLSGRAGGGGGGQSGIFGIGKSRAKRFNHETAVKVKFADVAGMDEAKIEIMEFVSFLKQPERFEKLGAKIPRGAILSGPPGTGKTLLAKATAGESGVPFYSVSGSEFVEMFVGVGPSRVRDLFATARKNTPCIIFIDEIDAIGRSRSKHNYGGGNDERESTLNQILTEMDGFNTSEQVVVLAGTNRADILDKALMRPGRFDRHISIDRPTMDGRKQIFGVHLRKIVTNEDMEYLKGRLAALTPGFSGADIANCVNEAALVAARVNAESVTMKHFEQAIERVIGGLEKKSLVLSPEEKRVVAYHEAGHAICGWYFKYADPLLKVSIIPRGQGALGYAQYLPSGESYLMNVRQLMDRMAMTLGGRVSEELHFDTVTSGASDDFNKVTRMATAMVTKFGMSPKIGHVYFDEEQQQFQKPFSEQTARDIDVEVRRIVDDAYKQCRDLLEAKKTEIGLVAEELLSKEVLGREDMVRLLGPRPYPDSGEFSKYFDGSPQGGVIAPPPPPQDALKEGETKGPEPPTPA